MITIRFAGWISGRIVSLQPDTDNQKLLSNGNRIRIRISETVLSMFREFRLLEKVAHCTIIHSLSSEASFQPSVPWLRVCLSMVQSLHSNEIPFPLFNLLIGHRQAKLVSMSPFLMWQDRTLSVAYVFRTLFPAYLYLD